MQPSATHAMLKKLSGLRTELVDLAFVLDGRGACEAADVAMTTAARLAELSEELSGPNSIPPPTAAEIRLGGFGRAASDLP